MRKRNHIESAMRNHSLVATIVAVMVVFGIYALVVMNKDEFPQVTIREGVVVAVYPGATAEEVEVQATKPLEDYLFTFKEVDNKQTFSMSQDGIAYIFPILKSNINDKDAVWAKVRGGLSLTQHTSLPSGVLAVALIDDFGNTSSVLLAVESQERSPRELETYCDELRNRLREIPELGSLKILGTQKEEIAVTLDVDRISQYAIDQKVIMAELASQGFRTLSGELDGVEGSTMVHVENPYQSEYEIGQQILFADPVTNQTVRLKDIATITRRYEPDSKHIALYEKNGDSTSRCGCVMLNIEMRPGNNIVAFGKAIDKVLAQMQQDLPPDVKFHKVTDQPKAVKASVISFLKDLLLSMLVVILVMLLLFPMRTALVASTSVPVCTAVSFGIMLLFGIELNTVTLAAMIVVLGMIVDDSVIVIDGYTEMLKQGHSRWYCAAQSTRQLLVPMALATTSISAMFFPMLSLMNGNVGDFINLFPWAILIALSCSIFFAIWVIPFMSFALITKTGTDVPTKFERLQEKFFNGLQNGYTKMLDFCFRHPWLTITSGVGMVLLGVAFLLLTDIQLLPKADRDTFAVEIHLTKGSNIKESERIADSLSRVLSNDSKVKDVTSFVGMASPRFHAVYAPQLGGPNYAQLIVNTQSNKATIELIEKYQRDYENAFPNAYVRFKQIDYQAVRNPIEIHIQGSHIEEMAPIADSLKAFMASIPELTWVHSNNDEVSRTVSIQLKEDVASQLGITQSGLSVYLHGALGKRGITSLWDGNYKTPVRLYSQNYGDLDCDNLGDLLVPCLAPGAWVPLRQVATLEPHFHPNQITHRNGVPTITVSSDVRGSATQMRLMKKIKHFINNDLSIPQGVSISYGGVTQLTQSFMPDLTKTIIAALLILLALLLFHFKKVTISILALSMSLLCIFGAFLGLLIFNLPFTITAVLGVISLIGIIVRNAIIMYEYANQLVYEHHLTSREAAYLAGQRRMRPIFLTSCTTALGVVPMILAHTSLWMPMGVVICFGTLFTLPSTITLLPIAFWKVFAKDTKRFEKKTNSIC